MSQYSHLVIFSSERKLVCGVIFVLTWPCFLIFSYVLGRTPPCPSFQCDRRDVCSAILQSPSCPSACTAFARSEKKTLEVCLVFCALLLQLSRSGRKRRTDQFAPLHERPGRASACCPKSLLTRRLFRGSPLNPKFLLLFSGFRSLSGAPVCRGAAACQKNISNFRIRVPGFGRVCGIGQDSFSEKVGRQSLWALSSYARAVISVFDPGA